MLRSLFFLGCSLLCLIIFSGNVSYREVCKKYANTYETGGYNRSKFIDACNTRNKVPLGSPYCATVTDSILSESGAVSPNISNGWARAFINGEAVPAVLVWNKKRKIPNDCVAVFVRRGGGHVGLYVKTFVVNGKESLCIFEPNTTPDGLSGSQHNGTWTGYKTREIEKFCSPFAPFRITHFVPVRYK